ncbi:MAG: hypothetical protein WC544_01880 [Patescibacteria group bacterium]
MQVTTQLVQGYIGGQLEIHDPDEDKLFRGEIEDIDVRSGILFVVFTWVARCLGPSADQARWYKYHHHEHECPLAEFTAANIGPGKFGSDRLLLTSVRNRVRITVFPPDGNRLARDYVIGLGANA